MLVWSLMISSCKYCGIREAYTPATAAAPTTGKTTKIERKEKKFIGSQRNEKERYYADLNCSFK